MAGASVWIFLLAASGLAASGPAWAAPLGFKDASLGMSLQAWRQAPFPGRANPRVAPACTAGGAGDRPGLSPASTASGAATQVCAYVSRYGSATITEDVPWAKGVLAKSPRYVFTDGRLSRIDIHVDIDAFDNIMARLKARYGKPSRMVRDVVRTRDGALPRVDVRWNTASGAVELVDPSSDLANMTISFIAAPGAMPPTAAAATAG